MKINFVSLLFFLFFCINSNLCAHKFAKYNIVIDTDCGLDDFRAITYFCASADFNINAITTTDGVLEPQQGANYLSELLKIYHHEGIKIGIGTKNNASKKYSTHALPLWQKFFSNNENKEFSKSDDLLYNAIKNNQNKTIIIALGPLTNISQLIDNHRDIIQYIDYILWYSNFNDIPQGYNYEQNKTAYENICNNRIMLKCLSAKDINFSKTFSADCETINTKYSTTLNKFFDKKLSDFSLWDDLLPLYILYPSLFKESFEANKVVKITTKEDAIYEDLILSILNTNKKDAGIVFNEVPSEGYFIQKDVKEFCGTIIDNYGYVEYKLCALTSEIHSHLGIYSIIGAKMGLRIMEYLHCGLDEIKIESLAGTMPPLSCLNDGIQVGTGATIGYGAISVRKTEATYPQIIVNYNNRKINIKLKNNIYKEISEKIQEIVNIYGLNSDMYWVKLREQSILYWRDLDRYMIFEINE